MQVVDASSRTSEKFFQLGSFPGFLWRHSAGGACSAPCIPQILIPRRQLTPCQMQSLPLSMIPEYLKEGELFRTLIQNGDDPDEEHTFPIRTLKPNTEVRCAEDCDLLLNSFRFWLVDDFSMQEFGVQMIEYALSPHGHCLLSVLENYKTEFSVVPWLIELLQTDPVDHWQVAIKSGLSALLATSRIVFPAEAVDLAAEVGNLDTLILLNEHGYVFSAKTRRNATKRGHSEVLQYLLNMHTGRPEVDLPLIAADAGDLSCLKVLKRHNCFCNVDICARAASRGHLECLQYAHENGCPWDEETCIEAAVNGQLKCLKYAHQHGCPWDEQICMYSLKYGHFDCFKYAHEHGCPQSERICAVAAKYGKLEYLQIAYENGCPWDEKTCSEAAEYGQLECLQYAHEKGCPWDARTCEMAARRGQLKCLQYAHEHGCPWDEWTCLWAAQYGHLKCLQYAQEHGCPLQRTLYFCV